MHMTVRAPGYQDRTIALTAFGLAARPDLAGDHHLAAALANLLTPLNAQDAERALMQQWLSKLADAPSG